MAKPGDFFVGVVDLFSILMPGAVLAYLSVTFVKAEDLGLAPIVRGSTEGWIAFFLAAYVLGHFLSAAGALFEELFDPVERWPGNHALAAGIAAERVGSRLDALSSKKGAGGDATDEWRNRLIKRLIKASVRAGNPATAAEADRLEASSKFFRSFAVVTLIFGVSQLLSYSPLVYSGRASWVFTLLALSVVACVSLALYVFQGRRRNGYIYVYFLVGEMASKGDGGVANGAGAGHGD